MIQEGQEVLNVKFKIEVLIFPPMRRKKEMHCIRYMALLDLLLFSSLSALYPQHRFTDSPNQTISFNTMSESMLLSMYLCLSKCAIG